MTERDDSMSKFIIKELCPRLLCLFSICTGQWMRPIRKNADPTTTQPHEHESSTKCLLSLSISLIMSVLALLSSLSIIGFFLYNWIKCPVKYHSICFTLQLYGPTTDGIITDVPHIVMRNNATDWIQNNQTELLQKYENLTKVFILFATSGSSLSYAFFVWALWCLYFRQWRIVKEIKCWNNCLIDCKNCFYCWNKEQGNEKDGTIKPLDPFNDNADDEDFDHMTEIDKLYKKKKSKQNFFKMEDKDTSTLLQGRRLCHFWSWFFIGFTLGAILLILFFSFYYTNDHNGNTEKFKNIFKVQIYVLTAHFYLLLCTFVSCFIFSKLMYGVQRKCEELEVYVYYVNEEYSKGSITNMYEYVKGSLETINQAQRESDSQGEQQTLRQVQNLLNTINQAFNGRDAVLFNDGQLQEKQQLINKQKQLAQRQFEECEKEQWTLSLETLSVTQRQLTQVQSILAQLNSLTEQQTQDVKDALGSLVSAQKQLAQKCRQNEGLTSEISNAQKELVVTQQKLVEAQTKDAQKKLVVAQTAGEEEQIRQIEAQINQVQTQTKDAQKELGEAQKDLAVALNTMTQQNPVNDELKTIVLKHLTDSQMILAQTQLKCVQNSNSLEMAEVQNNLAKAQCKLTHTLIHVSPQMIKKLAIVQNLLTQAQAKLIQAQQTFEQQTQLAETQLLLTEAQEQLNHYKNLVALQYLNNRDKHFVKTAVVTMEWFQLWFLCYWIFHIFSAFLAIGLLLDAIVLIVKARVADIKPGVEFHFGQVLFLFMLSAVHLFLLIYPCLRAAHVTRTRQHVIQKISEDYRFSNIPGEVLFKFVESMTKRKFSFRLRILCANIPYNLNVAYISIIFGFAGVAVSLVTTITT